MKGKLIVAIVVVVLIAVAVLFWPRRYEDTFYPMGGIPFKVVVYGRNMLEFDDDLSAVEKRVAELERAFELALADWGENEPLPWGDLD